MKRTDPLHLAADLRDLQIVDRDGEYCGIVDDIEFKGRAGGKLAPAAILTGPGAYRGRLPAWLYRLVTLVAGDRVVRVPWREIETIGSVVRLAKPAQALGLAAAERRAAQWLPGGGKNAFD